MNWIEFLDDHQIEYVTRGPNTRRGEVSVQCPWCGSDDPSHHLGISLSDSNWGCLRNSSHRGHSATFLVAALVGCSQSQARLVAAQYEAGDPGRFDTLVTFSLTSEAPKPAEAPSEALPNLIPIKPTGTTAKFWHYLKDRGFADPVALTKTYHLWGCLIGRFKDRIIIPFYQGGEMVAWTGRAIVDPQLAPRYLSSKLVKTTVFNEDNLNKGGRLLYVVEGPFDVLKLDYYGQQYGANATCIFGTSMTLDQVLILTRLTKLWDQVVILFDHDAVEPLFTALDWLQAPNVTLGQLPEGVKDPGSMTQQAIHELIKDTLTART